MSALFARKTPQQARSRVTYDAIVEAAARIIAAGGLAAFNTNAVAERAGVSIGSLYQYFPNKDALMAALIERQQARQLANLQGAVSVLAAQPLPEIVRTLVRAAMQHHREDALLASAIDHEEQRLPLGGVLDGFLDQGGEAIMLLLEARRAELPGIDPANAARTLPALVRVVVDAWANRNPPQLERAEAEAVRAVLGYLRGG